MKKGMKILLFCLSSLTLISWDRASKELAKEHLKDKATLSYFHDTIRLQYVENTGAAMGFADDLPKQLSFWLLSMAPLALLLGMSGYVIKNSDKMNGAKMAAFTLIIAGGLGNIYDRIVFDRHVTDFMNIGINDLRTGIFNFADVCITAGAILLLASYRNKNTA
ncbi:MAG: signal peptidase II [Chitinophagaceae bacterium]|nr:signal peptidase II [Chitinophagaceae bacterium]